MTPAVKGAILGVVHVAMVLSLGAKLLIDRSTMPRVWARTAPYDPDLPIRGRYLSLRLLADAKGFAPGVVYHVAKLSVENGRLVARPSEDSGDIGATVGKDESIATLTEPDAYFIPEHAVDPSRRPSGEELWVEVTVPPKGPPRPIRLGVKRDGVLTPLDLN
jgi:hypothetical protein